jgi:hypothetical protein
MSCIGHDRMDDYTWEMYLTSPLLPPENGERIIGERNQGTKSNLRKLLRLPVDSPSNTTPVV